MTLHYLLINLYGMAVLGFLFILSPIINSAYRQRIREKKIRKEFEDDIKKIG